MNAFKLGRGFRWRGLGNFIQITGQNANWESKSSQVGDFHMSQLAGLRVLCFHSISDLSGTEIARYGIPKNEFKCVIDTLLNRGFDFFDPRKLFGVGNLAGRLRDQSLLITFDDGYEDILDAFDVLKMREIRAFVFPVSSLIGMANEWDKGRDIPTLPLLTRDQINFLADNGWMIGSHTRTHADLRSLDDSSVVREILESISDLKSLDVSCAMALAYPYGFYNNRIVRLAMEAGLRFAFTTDPGIITEHTGPMTIPRIEVYRGELGDTLVNKVVRDTQYDSRRLRFRKFCQWAAMD